MNNNMEDECAMCSSPTQGYKCDVCDAESMTHDETHDCGGDHCVAKCKACGEAETNCAC